MSDEQNPIIIRIPSDLASTYTRSWRNGDQTLDDAINNAGRADAVRRVEGSGQMLRFSYGTDQPDRRIKEGRYKKTQRSRGDGKMV